MTPEQQEERCLLLLARTIPVFSIATICTIALFIEVFIVSVTDPLGYWAKVGGLCLILCLLLEPVQRRLLLNYNVSQFALSKTKLIADVYRICIGISFVVWGYAVLQVQTH